MQLLKGFSLIKEVVMRLKSPFKVKSLLKHRNFDFALSRRGGGGVTLILNLIFRRVG